MGIVASCTEGVKHEIKLRIVRCGCVCACVCTCVCP